MSGCVVIGNNNNNPRPAAPPQVRLKSLKSETEAFILFNNTSGARVRALWMDFRGHEVGDKRAGDAFLSLPAARLACCCLPAWLTPLDPFPCCLPQVAYSIIEPGTKKKYRTFVSHPWVAREVASGKRMMLNDSMVSERASCCRRAAASWGKGCSTQPYGADPMHGADAT